MINSSSMMNEIVSNTETKSSTINNQVLHTIQFTVGTIGGMLPGKLTFLLMKNLSSLRRRLELIFQTTQPGITGASYCHSYILVITRKLMKVL